MKKPDWIKSKGYIHITPTIDTHKNWQNVYFKISNKRYIASYAFYPLIYAEIKERKYKKFDTEKHTNKNKSGRTHKLVEKEKGAIKRTRKLRPLHYASHFDSLIYGYYADLLSKKYKDILDNNLELNSSVTAYRKIEIEEGSGVGKSTIHFAKEAFDEIIKRSNNGPVAALTFDIKSFFSSLDHKHLKEKWCELIGKNRLPKDHFNVFNSCTNFRYVLRDDLRVKQVKGGRRSGFDERKLSKIRKTKGYKCFFYDDKDFREHISSGKLGVYKNTFFNDLRNPGFKQNVGIPQGLPISAVLANIYLLDFDRIIIEKLVDKLGVYYRRYSDDIFVVCNVEDIQFVKQFITDEIKNSFIEISELKTEQFIFEEIPFNKNNETRLTSFKVDQFGVKTIKPLIYLGFEFRGYSTIIKATNLARYYRRLLSVVKRRAKRANTNFGKTPFTTKAVYLNQIKKLYNAPLQLDDAEHFELKQRNRTRYRFEKSDLGHYELVLYSSSKRNNSNYITYLKRCDKVFKKQRDSSFLKQLRKRKSIVNHAVQKHLLKG